MDLDFRRQRSQPKRRIRNARYFERHNQRCSDKRSRLAMGINGMGQPRWQSVPCWRLWIRFPEYSAYRLSERRLGVSTEHRPVDLVEGFHRRGSTLNLHYDSNQLLPAELHE